MQTLRRLKPDVFISMQSQIFSQELLEIPSITCLNCHPALLPKYRSSSPHKKLRTDRALAQSSHRGHSPIYTLEGIDETLTYYCFPSAHWRRIRTYNPLERILREVRRRTRVIGAFPDGNSALMLVAVRLRHIAGTRWGTRRYLNMNLLEEVKVEEETAA